MTLGTIRADHEQMVPGERDGIGLHATRRQTDRCCDTEEIATAYQFTDAV